MSCEWCGKYGDYSGDICDDCFDEQERAYEIGFE